ncbi:MAG: DUF6580 family putative transport protein [Patescibacteria group bacterium]
MYYLPAILLLALGLVARLAPHPANFTPIAAIALFGALYLPRKLAIAVPLATMFISDIFIGFYEWPIMTAVYASFAIAGIIGLVARKNKKFRAIFGGTLLASLTFFLITNAAVWAFGTMYPRNLSGLFESYYMAIPFFRNSLLGDLFYTGILVGGMEAISLLKKQPVEIKN